MCIFAVMNQKEKLGQIEYEDVLLDNLSKLVINRNYIRQNLEFWDDLVFKLFEEYYFSSEDVSIRTQARHVEILLGSMFKHKPEQELPDDLLFFD